MQSYRYALRRISGPEDEPVSLDEARRNCKLDEHDHDYDLVNLIRQSREYVEERTDVSLLTTQWSMTADGFPRSGKWIELPRWPVATIDEIAYTSAAGTEATLDLADVRLRIDEHGRGRIARKNWDDWPETANTPDAMRIKFTAGWTDRIKIPATWQRAMLMLITHWFENPGGSAKEELPVGVEALLQAAATLDDFDEFEAG